MGTLPRHCGSHDEFQKPKRMIGIHTDISVRKAVELQLVAAREEAEQANRAKSEFLSNMSHELRTPMNAILGFGQLLENDDGLNESQQEDVKAILKAGNHLLSLINEVLDLAKVESGYFDLSIEPVDVKLVIDDSLRLVRSIAEKRSIIINIPAGVTVKADHTRFKQVMLNLLSNAIKYNLENGTVKINAQAMDHGFLRISITDTGLGISTEQIAEIFEPFNRLGAENTGIEGTGIGLTITRRIVEKMGGTVDIESEVGLGSTFWVELPLELMPDSNSSDNFEETKGSTDTTKHMNKTLQHTVLYIDDNPVNIQLVTQILARHKRANLLSSTTQDIGVELAKQHLPDLILLDINMPGMNGYKVLDILKADKNLNAIPVIAVTANAMSSDIERGLAAGFSDYLTKPFDMKKLLNIIDRYLLDSTNN